VERILPDDVNDTGHTVKACICGHGWDEHLVVVGGCPFCSCRAHPPNQPMPDPTRGQQAEPLSAEELERVACALADDPVLLHCESYFDLHRWLSGALATVDALTAERDALVRAARRFVEEYWHGMPREADDAMKEVAVLVGLRLFSGDAAPSDGPETTNG
jgi:hypothetical protein